MMNLFSLSSLRWLCGLLSLVALAVAALLVGERLGVEVDLGGAQPWMAALLLLLSLATALVGLVLHRSLYQSRRITAAMAAAAAGDMEARLTHIPQGGEFSNLMHSTNRLLDQVDAFVREAGASMHHVAQQRYFRRILQRGLRGEFRRTAETINQASGAMEAKVEHFRSLNDAFESSVKGVAHGVAAAATELHATAGVMAEMSRKAEERSISISRSSRETLHNVESVATASEQLSASVNEISGQVTEASDKANSAAQTAHQASAIIRQLSQSSERIGEISQLINTIADRTNLLALNAAIEASRAGESGKGFAVVAQEVKDLARQTAEATDEIGRQIANVQEMTRRAVTAIEGTTAGIDDLDGITARIASAVSQQSSSTSEISRHMQHAAEHTRSVNEIITQLAEAVSETNDAVTQTLEAAGELSRQAELLNQKVEDYMSETRVG